MTARSRFLTTSPSPPQPPLPNPSSSPAYDAFHSDYVVFIASLLCALICVLGLVAVARCTWLRRIITSRSSSNPSTALPENNKGLKKKVLNSLPKLTYGGGEDAVKLSDECAICLAEFVAGEEVRVLPQCGHVFHVACVDTWLRRHSTCPSCRRVLVVGKCEKCGRLPTAGGGGVVPEPREGYHVDRFLP